MSLAVFLPFFVIPRLYKSLISSEHFYILHIFVVLFNLAHLKLKLPSSLKLAPPQISPAYYWKVSQSGFNLLFQVFKLLYLYIENLLSVKLVYLYFLKICIPVFASAHKSASLPSMSSFCFY